MASDEVIRKVNVWRDVFQPAETTEQTISAEFDLASTHHFTIWDAVIMAAASEAGCDLRLSEDMQDGFTWRGVMVVNPLASAPDLRLAQFTEQGA